MPFFSRRMRLSVLGLSAALTASGLAQAEPGSVAVGPWTVAAVFKANTFANCVMSRTTPDGVDVRILRDDKGVALAMSSPRWRLGRGKSYTVDLIAGNLDLQADVSANGDGVSVRLTDDEFIGKLAQANELDVKGAGSTIKVALDQSAAGLDRLDACYAKNAKSSTEANPFVAPKRAP